MSQTGRAKGGTGSAIRDYFAATFRHPLGFLGACVTTVAGVLLVILIGMELMGMEGNPYLGIVTFLILPALFVGGLLMMPLGHYLEGKRRARAGAADAVFPRLDLNDPRTRNRFVLFLGVTLLNVVILVVALARGIEFMDSVQFCGETCHAVMAPELTAHQDSPHARVRCVDCHIGPGASWFVRSKLSGTRQVFATLFHTYPTPIPTPVHNLRPSRDTCEQCHWPEKFHGTNIAVRTKYDEDEANTPLTTVLALKIGGGIAPRPAGDEPAGPAGTLGHGGIHWHVSNQVEYVSDENRETIERVRVHQTDGTIREFRRPGAATGPWPGEPESGAGPAAGLGAATAGSFGRLFGGSAHASEPEGDEPSGARHVRTMDCVDCHNRPTHIYHSAKDAVNLAMAGGSIPATLPYIRREVLAAVTAEYDSFEAARAGIEDHLRRFYAAEYPDLAPEQQEALAAAIAGAREVYERNVFPPMRIGWDTYPTHIGHEQSPGCFRCHDGELATESGETISQDCSLCHTLLAVEEQDPAVLNELFPEE